MWWWDLYETGERKCYNRESALFHEATCSGCKDHEMSVRALLGMKLDADRRFKARKKQCE